MLPVRPSDWAQKRRYEMSVVVLVGNGLSISYNGDLAVPALTEELIRRFRNAGGDLQAIAAAVDEDGPKGFEQLLGPFDAVSAMIRTLPGLRHGRGWAPGFDDLGRALEAARGIHMRGTGIALSIVAERSHRDGDFTSIDAFCSAVATLDDPAELTIATLNYDGLLTAGFLQEFGQTGWNVERTLDTSDMADGRTGCELTPDFAEGGVIESWELRRIPDFMPERARLLNLHGSLGWLRNGENPEEVRRFRIPDLREAGYWAKYIRGATVWEPVVVLTNRKTELAREWPFQLCYTEFTGALVQADHWLIAGYGLGDRPVNDAFGRAARARRDRDQESRVLVIGRGDPDALRHCASERLGIPPEWIIASGDGLPDAIDGECWHQWAP